MTEPAKRRRIRRDPETTRRLILDAAECMMVEEGYAAVGSRRVAAAIGLNAATIHYYFATIDDLFVAMHARMTDRQLAELKAVLDEADPLLALWRFLTRGEFSALGVEFAALSNHRKSIQPVIARTTERARQLQAEWIERRLGTRGDPAAALPMVAVATILVAISRGLANEERVGITLGHADVRALVEGTLGRLGSAAG